MQTEILEGQRRLSNILWGQARFIKSREIQGKRVSLYLLNREYYIIWYSTPDFESLEKIEPIPFSTVTELFGKLF